MSERFTKEQIAEILELIGEAYKQVGRDLETVTIYDEEKPEGEIVVDNRDEEKIN